MSTPIKPGDPMRVAVITPYYKPNMDWLRQCHESVLAQTHPCTHILVADSDPVGEVDAWQAQHIRGGIGHADYGDTPRGIGSMSAIGQGFDAITYLDADNWYSSPDHIERLVKLHRESGASVCISSRNLCRPDGTLLGPCPESDGNYFADTSCILLTRRAFGIASVWAMMDPPLHAIDDRIIMWRIREAKLKRAFNNQHTVAYRTTFPGHYKRFGQPPPPETKADVDPMRAAYAYLVATGGPDLRPKHVKKQNPTIRHPAPSLDRDHGTTRVAVITPYFRTPIDWLRQCHESVLAQTHPCTHIMVADGESIDAVDGWKVQHMRCSHGHADYGDTPRAIGSMSAIGQGFDAITYLDADNWYSPEHIEMLVALHKRTDAQVCFANRNLYRPDGSLLGPCPETDGDYFADTSSMFLTRDAFRFAQFWALMDSKLHAIGDRVMMHRFRNSKLKRAFNEKPTVAYRTTFPADYERTGEVAPREVKSSTKSMDEAYAHLLSMGGPDLRPKQWKEQDAGGKAISRNKVIMFHNGRCGSSVLGDLLNQHPKVHWDSEIFNAPNPFQPKPQPWQRWIRSPHYPSRPFKFLRSRIQQGPKDWYGFEIQFYQLRELSVPLSEFVSKVTEMGFERFILLDRKNYLRAVVSNLLASQRSKFRLTTGERPELKTVRINIKQVYPREDSSIIDLLLGYERTFQELRSLVTTQAVLELNYEDHILESPLAAYRLACEFIGIKPRTPRVEMARATPWPLSEVVENFDELVAALRGTPYEWMTEG